MLHKRDTGRLNGNERMKTLLLACIFVSPLVLLPVAAAEGRNSRPPVAEDKKVFSAQESKAMGEAAQRRGEARQKDWDRKMKSIAKGICVGC